MNNIALVKLSKDVKRGKFVQSVCLPKNEEGDLAKMKAYGIATCWPAIKLDELGRIPDWADRRSNHLQYSSHLIQSNRLCSKISGAPSFNSTVSFCAEVRDSVNHSCHGDTGGVFIQTSKGGDRYRWVATGVVSCGGGCASEGQFSFYTWVYQFIDWIMKTVDRK